MENRNNLLFITLIAVIILLSWGLTKDFNERNAPVSTSIHVCKEDSLKKTIDSLSAYITLMEDGFDFKERRYEEILFEYEFGIDHLKNYHPEAYKDFHRIIAHKERFSKQVERDNKKMLSPQNF
jgi:hypothetical protein